MFWSIISYGWLVELMPALNSELYHCAHHFKMTINCTFIGFACFLKKWFSCSCLYTLHIELIDCLSFTELCFSLSYSFCFQWVLCWENFYTKTVFSLDQNMYFVLVETLSTLWSNIYFQDLLLKGQWRSFNLCLSTIK